MRKEDLLAHDFQIAASLVCSVDTSKGAQTPGDPGFFLDFTWSSMLLQTSLALSRPLLSTVRLVIIDDSVWDLDRCMTILSGRRQKAGSDRIKYSSISAYQPHEIDRAAEDSAQAATVGKRPAGVGMNNLAAIRRLVERKLVDVMLVSPEQAVSRTFRHLVHESPVAVSSRSATKLPESVEPRGVFSTTDPLQELDELLSSIWEFGTSRAELPKPNGLRPRLLTCRWQRKALNTTLSHIDAGTVPTGPTATKCGSSFKNWGGYLPGPSGASSPYLDYRVAPPPGVFGAGRLRVVVNQQSGATY